jgi:hypothetical protein
MIYKNDLEYGWSRDRENDSITGDTMIFRQVQASRRIIVLHLMFLYCSCQLMVRLCLFDFSSGVYLPLLLYPRGRDYKEDNRVGYNMIPIRTLSLLAYFTYIFIDIIIYVLRSTLWSSGIFWMVVL